MPLLAPVGEALFDYLRHGRPRTEAREVFVRSCAPYIAMTNLYGMVRGRLSAAGVEPPGKRGPHVFRHARAVEMLRASVRSEEHTSELQSLMRTSYAVFCLKKNKTNNRTKTPPEDKQMYQQTLTI